MASSNNNFANAFEVVIDTEGGTYISDVLDITTNTAEPGEPLVGPTYSHTAWWRYRPQFSGLATVEAVLEPHHPAAGFAAYIGESVGELFNHSGYALDGEFSFPVEAGATYFIQGFAAYTEFTEGAPGTFQLTVTGPESTPLAPDLTGPDGPPNEFSVRVGASGGQPAHWQLLTRYQEPANPDIDFRMKMPSKEWVSIHPKDTDGADPLMVKTDFGWEIVAWMAPPETLYNPCQTLVPVDSPGIVLVRNAITFIGGGFSLIDERMRDVKVVSRYPYGAYNGIYGEHQEFAHLSMDYGLIREHITHGATVRKAILEVTATLAASSTLGGEDPDFNPRNAAVRIHRVDYNLDTTVNVKIPPSTTPLPYPTRVGGSGYTAGPVEDSTTFVHPDGVRRQMLFTQDVTAYLNSPISLTEAFQIDTWPNAPFIAADAPARQWTLSATAAFVVRIQL